MIRPPLLPFHMPPDPVSLYAQLRARSPLVLGAYGLLVAVVCIIVMQAVFSAEPEGHAALMRYWALLSAAVVSVAASNMLFPDRFAPGMQLLNPSPTALLRYQMMRWAATAGVLVVPAVLLSVFAGGPLAPQLNGVLVVAGVALYGFADTVALGPVSHAWSTGAAGQWYTRVRETSGAGFSVPRGLVPYLFSTSRCFLLGAAGVLGEGLLRAAGQPGLSVAAGCAVLGWAVWRLRPLVPVFDRFYYRTHAFFQEVLGGSMGVSDRDPIPYASLYWVPSTWRPAVWASLRQLDRRLPLGRFVALGHILFWGLVYQGVASVVVSGYLALFVLVQNGIVLLLTRPELAPAALHLSLQRPLDWIITRWFVAARWLGPFAGSIGLVAWASRSYTATDMLLWTAIYAAVAVGTALWTTARVEGAYRQKLA